MFASLRSDDSEVVPIRDNRTSTTIDGIIEKKVEAANEEQKLKQRDRVKTRLRAILDGTDVD